MCCVAIHCWIYNTTCIQEIQLEEVDLKVVAGELDSQDSICDHEALDQFYVRVGFASSLQFSNLRFV